MRAAARAAAAAPRLWRRQGDVTHHAAFITARWPQAAAAALPADAQTLAPTAAAAPRMRLPPGEVHVWWMATGDDDDDAAVHAAADAMRGGGLVPDADAAAAADVAAVAGPGAGSRAVLSRGLVRWILTKYTGVAPADLLFDREPRGKPRIVPSTLPTPPLEFNVTHTRGLLGVAVAAPGTPVGVDAELAARTPRRGALAVARRHFSPADVAALEAVPAGPARDAEFVALWTLKEAYVKATGDGIARGGLASAPLRLRDDDTAAAAAALDAALPGLPRAKRPRLVEWDGDDSGAWRFALLQPTARHVAAVCVASPAAPAPLRVRAWRAVPLGDDGELGRGAVALAASRR